MPTLRRLVPAVLAAALALPAYAAIPREERAAFRLEATRTAYAAGKTARLLGVINIENGWHVNAHKPSFDYLIPTAIEVDVPAGFRPARVLYPAGGLRKFGFAPEPILVYEGEVAIPIEVDVPAGTPDGKLALRGRLRYQACSDKICLPPVDTQAAIDLVVGPDGKEVRPAAPATPSAVGARRPGLAWMLLVALLGGLILNAMPCVLPVLSLKVFGLVRSAGQGRAHVTLGALATAAGILLSFLALAGAAIAAKSAGAAVGWGVQFQNPAFVTFLAVVVILFCLNLWGLFEVPLPQRLARVAESAQGGEGVAGHFASGLFATLMATPCSAPFLGTAVGFALGQSAPVILAIFAAVGLGMASPYLLLAAAPGFAQVLPRPGAWMDTLKGLMGFLLAGAAVWLFYVLAAQMAPDRLALVQLGLLAMALCGWLLHRQAPGTAARSVAGLAMLVLAAGTVLFAAGAEAQPTATASAPVQRLIPWRPWDRAEAERLAAEGKPVFVDVTAEWCFTCKVNERLVLETPEMAAAFAHHGVIAMRADWTNRSDTIAQFLAEHGRYGIPFYLLYRPGQEPRLFPELLTKDLVLRELEAIGGAQTASAPG